MSLDYFQNSFYFPFLANYPLLYLFIYIQGIFVLTKVKTLPILLYSQTKSLSKAAHDNDAGNMLHEMIRFDETLSYIFEWVKERNDTLLIVTADHVTGGFGFSCSKRNIPEPTDFPGPVFKGLKFKPTYHYGSYDILDRIYQQKASYEHMMKEFDALPNPEQTSAAMAEIVNRNIEFPITEAEASAECSIPPNGTSMRSRL